MIEVENLSKRYGTKLAVDGLSFVVQPGIVTGFLPIAQAEVGQHSRDVGLHGGGDLGVGQAQAQRPQHLGLPVGEPLQVRRARSPTWDWFVPSSAD